MLQAQPGAARVQHRKKRRIGIDADEGAGDNQVRRVVGDAACLERFERRFDLAEPAVDLFGQFVGPRIFLFERVGLGAQRLGGRPLLVAERDRLARQAPHAGIVPVRKVNSGLDPFPALGADAIGFGRELFGDERGEQPRVLQPAAVILLKQIAHNDAAGCLVSLDADEAGALVGGAHGALG